MTAGAGGRLRAIADVALRQLNEQIVPMRALASLAIACLLVLAGTARAAITVYANQTAVSACVLPTGIRHLGQWEIFWPLPMSDGAPTTSTSPCNNCKRL
jgi:hypothetical protein